MLPRAALVASGLAVALLAGAVGSALLGVSPPLSLSAGDEADAPAASHHDDQGAADAAAPGDTAGHEHGEVPEGYVMGPGEHDHPLLMGMGVVARALPRPEHFRVGEVGRIPARADAADLPHQLRSFRVEGDDGLAQMRDEGYVSGVGTKESPYILDGLRVADDLVIEDTNAPLIIRNSLVEGQLKLNYNGPFVYVHHNRINDLRVNENVDRDADSTEGLFEHNAIAFIGQLRHFKGTFAHNAIGPRPDGVLEVFLGDSGQQAVGDGIVWNFDGYHGAHVHNNTVEGPMEIKLHGHYHGSCNECVSHDHANQDEFPPGDRGDGSAPGSHHSYRFHTLDFENNVIRVDDPTRPAVRVNDANHAGDDQTASSEPNEFLEDQHEHHLFMRIAGNRVQGGALMLDIVNAKDSRHDDMAIEALIHLVGNSVTMQKTRGGVLGTDVSAAYIVEEAGWTNLVATGNSYKITKPAQSSILPFDLGVNRETPSAGFAFIGSYASQALIMRTTGGGAQYGIFVHGAPEGIQIESRGNDFNAKEDVHHG